jgi:hypothetical protein
MMFQREQENMGVGNNKNALYAAVWAAVAAEQVTGL